jgi:hypothetical protein
LKTKLKHNLKKNAAAKKLNLFFPNSTTKRNMRNKDGFAFALGLPNGLRYPQVGGLGKCLRAV